MNSIEQHLSKLKNFVPPDINDGENKIYFLEVEEKAWPKVGDTHRDVEERNRETMTNAALHRKKGTKPFYVLAKKWNGETFRDKEFHAFLKKKGYVFELNDQGNDSEWVEKDPAGNVPTVEQLLKELEGFVQKPVYKTVELRTAQHYVLGLLEQAKSEGYKYVNLGACVRIGKTVISLTHSSKNNWMPVYIGKNLTSQSSAETDNKEFGIVTEMLTQSLHGIDELDDSDLSKKTKQIIQNINQTNVNNKPIIFFIDEVDDASHTKKSRNIITPVVNFYEEQGLLAQVIPMSGTRIYRGEKILKDLPDGPIKEISIEYYEMQILQPETTCRREFRHISFYSESKDGLSNISDSMKNKDSGHKSLATVIEKLLGTNNFDFTVNPNFPHWFIKFATVGKDNAKKFVGYLNRNHSKIENQEFYFVEINGDVTSSKEAQEYCKSIIKNNPNKICVFITQGMATTSFSVVGIGNSAVFTDNELTADDIQALHRSVTWDEGKEYGNLIVITTNNSMEHSFDDIFEDETKIAKTREEKETIYRELLNNNSMIHFTVNGESIRPVKITKENVDKVLDKKAKSMTKVASLIGVINDLDEDILDNILLTVSGKKNSSIKSSSTQGNKFDPFGNPDSIKPSQKNDTDDLSVAQKEKILRAFIEGAVNVPAIAREQETTLENFTFWNEIGISKELFFDVYNSSWQFKDRIDMIYNLCEDDNYLIENYINKLAL